MIGVLDSGAGGRAVARELQKRLSSSDLLCLADRANAPYGTKCRGELIRLVSRGVSSLLDRGAGAVLIACCTASTVWGDLPEELRARSIPILPAAAEAAARATKTGRISLIATEATVRSEAFSRALAEISPDLTLFSHAAQPLVALVERGERDGSLSPRGAALLDEALSPVREDLLLGADVLILGCTHFPHLGDEIARRLPGVFLADPATAGAAAAERILRSRFPGAIPGRGSLKDIETVKRKERKTLWQNTDAAGSTTP